MMTIRHTDVAVIGGGMVGGALALGLAQNGFSVVVLDKAPPPAFDPTAQPDVRISAISAARFNRLGMDALGCQVAVSLMFVSPNSDKGTKSTRKRHMTQILPGD